MNRLVIHAHGQTGSKKKSTRSVGEAMGAGYRPHRTRPPVPPHRGVPDGYIIARDEARSDGSSAPEASGLELTAATRSSALSTASVASVAAR